MSKETKDDLSMEGKDNDWESISVIIFFFFSSGEFLMAADESGLDKM